VIPDTDEVDVSCGQNTPLEIPLRGHRYTDRAGTGELVLLLQTVFEGRFSETLWTTRSGRIVKTLGVFDTDERRIAIMHTTVWRWPFGRLEERQIHYESYCRPDAEPR
jgi:hypothetical protein